MFSSSQMFTSNQISEGLGFGTSQTPAANSPEGAKRPRQEEKQTCLPVTIRAMEVAVAQRAEGGDDLKFFGTEPSMLIIVAAVESVVRQSTGLELSLNDATGRIKARYFVTDPQPGHLESIVEGRYISAFGSVRSAPAMHFAINGLRLVESADEVSYHMIEAAYAALRLQHGPKEPATPAPKRAAVEAAPDLLSPQKDMSSVPAAPPAAAVATAPEASPQAAPVKPAGALSGAELRAGVLEAIRGEESPEGMALTALFAKFPTSTQGQVREVVDGLVSDGEIFGTIDDEHFSAV
mmetsp:Transcript_151497/g.385105  ORF Transcript_151497/g.385105 Transcript_151497/m.385105 type:complete len:294 (+) Transcript_151497:67-948(+)